MPKGRYQRTAEGNSRLGQYERTPEIRAKLRAAFLGKKMNVSAKGMASRIASALGRPKSVAERARLSSAIKNSPVARAQRDALIDAQRGIPRSLADRAKMSAGKQRRIASDPAYKAMLIANSIRMNEAHLVNKNAQYLSRSGKLYRMRSSWEIEFAEALDIAGLTWFYEPVRLLLSDGRTYVPDFYVEEWKQYVEIKGWDGWHSDKPALAQADGYPIRLISGRVAMDEALATCGNRPTN
jgi:hypothetical protein